MSMPGDPPSNAETAYQRAQIVKRTHAESLLKMANVVGLGVGLRQRDGKLTDEVALIVLVRQKHPIDHLHPEEQIPASIEGVPVDVQEIGEPHAGAGDKT